MRSRLEVNGGTSILWTETKTWSYKHGDYGGAWGFYPGVPGTMVAFAKLVLEPDSPVWWGELILLCVFQCLYDLWFITSCQSMFNKYLPSFYYIPGTQG